MHFHQTDMPTMFEGEVLSYPNRAKFMERNKRAFHKVVEDLALLMPHPH